MGRLSTIILISVFLFCPIQRAWAEERPIILGVHPYLPSVEVIERFTPLAEYLSKRLGRDVIIEVSKDYETHIKQTCKRYDISFMGPVSYLKMVKLCGEKPPLARLQINGKPTFRGVIFVRKTSPIMTLKDLKGKRFAFGDPNSTMGHLVPIYMLIKAGIKLDMLSGYSFISNHENVVLGVLSGDYDAGAVMIDVFKSYESRGLRAIAYSPIISEHIFVAGNNIDEPTAKKFRNALMELNKNLSVLTPIKKDITGLSPASLKDYDMLSKILSELDRIGIRY